MSAEGANPALREGIDRRALAAGAAIVGVGTVLLYVVRPSSTDYTNGRFRAFLFDEVGFAPWNNMWLNGHHTPAYSLLAPPITSVAGTRVTAALSLAALVASFVMVLRAVRREGALLRHEVAASCSVAALGAAPLMIGQTAYLLGMACGMCSMWLLLDRYPVLASVAGLLAGAASPTAGLYLAIAAAAMCTDRRWRAGAAATGIASFAGFALPVMLFPEGGDYYPFSRGGTINLVVLVAVVIVVARRFRLVVAGGVLYAALVLLTVLDVTGLGNIVARLGGLLAAPIAVLAWQGRRSVAATFVAGALAFQWAPVAGIAFSGVAEQRELSVYEPVLEVLRTLPPGSRVEVVPMRTHDEADRIARFAPIARGWHRHLDRKYNWLFYDDTSLTADEYLVWLVEHDVAVVAIADTKLDYGGTKERELLERPPDYLEPVVTDGMWRVFLVRQPPQADVAEVTFVQPASLGLRFEQPGAQRIAVHFSPWFVVDGPACVRDSGDGWTVVEASSAGEVVVRATLSWRAVVDRDGTC
jgi:hypothetical protein